MSQSPRSLAHQPFVPLCPCQLIMIIECHKEPERSTSRLPIDFFFSFCSGSCTSLSPGSKTREQGRARTREGFTNGSPRAATTDTIESGNSAIIPWYV